MPATWTVEVAFATQPLAASPTWTDVTGYLDQAVQSPLELTRGRTDEFADVQPSTLRLVLDNSDGRFTLGRAASPYYPGVRVGRRIRVRVAWTPKNWVPNGTFDTDVSGWVAGGSVPPTLARSTTVVHDGAGSLQVTWGTGGTSPSAGTTITGLQVGQAYTAQAWLRVPSAQGGPHVLLSVVGIGATSAPTDTLDAWQLRTVTFVATATSHTLQVIPVSSPTAGNVARADSVQLEEGTAATAFDGTPPTTYYRFDGHVNEWPTTWEGPGAAYAPATVTATDRLKRLGTVGELRSMLEEEVLRDAPGAYYPLGEPGGALSAASVTKTVQAPATVRQAGSGGTLDFGSGTGPGTDGESAVVLAPASSTAGPYLQADLTTPVGGGSGVSLGAWVATTATSRVVAALFDASGAAVLLAVNASGQPLAFAYDAIGLVASAGWATAVNNGRTRQLAATVALSGTTLTLRLYVDGVERANATGAATGLPVGSYLGVGWWKSNPPAYGIFSGTLSHVAAWPSTLAAGRVADHDHAGTDGWSGERSDVRIGRLADYLAIPAADRNLDVGDATVGAQSTSGVQDVEAMRQVERTEAGVLFLDGQARLTLHRRSRRYNTTPAVTLDCAAGHVEGDLSFPGDDFGLTNDMTVTRPGGSPARAVDQASIDEYGLYRDGREVAAATDAAMLSLAQWRVGLYADTRVRLPAVAVDLATLDPTSSTLVGQLLAADVSTKLRVANLPSQAPASQVDVFVEGLVETVGVDVWRLAFTCSPGDVAQVWQLGVAGYSELGTTTRLAI